MYEFLMQRYALQPHYFTRRVAWFDAAAKHSDLLYISDEGSNAVYIYSWPKARRVGELAEISYPQGECVDGKGNVYITSVVPPYGSYIVKYPHGSATPAGLVDDPGFIANGCAVDTKTGNIAVANLETFKFGYGSLNLYKKSGRLIAKYGNANLLYYFFCAFDRQGNLYVDGVGDYNPFDVFNAAELPAGSNQLSIVHLNQAISFPGAIQAHERVIAIGDTDEDVVYEFVISGSTGAKVGTTPLRGANHLLQFFIEHRSIVGASASTETVLDWHFPAGGRGERIGAGFTDPVGVAISEYRPQ